MFVDVWFIKMPKVPSPGCSSSVLYLFVRVTIRAYLISLHNSFWARGFKTFIIQTRTKNVVPLLEKIPSEIKGMLKKTQLWLCKLGAGSLIQSTVENWNWKVPNSDLIGNSANLSRIRR